MMVQARGRESNLPLVGSAKLVSRPPTYTRLLEADINLGQLSIWLEFDNSNEQHNTSMNKAEFRNQFGIQSFSC